MVIGIVEVGLVVEQVMVVEKMNFVVDFAGIVDKETITEDMVVGMTVGRDVGMVVGMDVGIIDFHNNILSNLEKFRLVLPRKPIFPRNRRIP